MFQHAEPLDSTPRYADRTGLWRAEGGDAAMERLLTHAFRPA
jgi:hypothetical protein